MAYRQHRHSLTIMPLLLGMGLLFATTAEAEQTDSVLANSLARWANCPPPPTIFTDPPPASSAKPGQTELSADEVISQAGGISHFRGHVVMQHNGRTLQGDEAGYDQQTQEVKVEGNVLFHGDGLAMQGDSASMHIEQNRGEFNGVSFYFPASHAFGRAESLSLNGAEYSTLKQVSYTTCSPGQEDWLLSAKELQLDQQSNTGEAYHTVFRFKGVPIFYSPYLNFPLAGRKSGLLFPLIGNSDTNGSDISLPLYWNIAPNYDATFTPRNLSNRGAMLMSEFRLLSENSEGQIQADYLSDDKIYGDDRNYLAVDHRAHFANGWNSTLKLRRTSDALYLNDLGSTEGDNSSTHLERRLDLNYRDQHWNFLARAQSYQTLSGSAPYQRLPQLKLSGQSTPRPNRLQLSLDSEAVTFAHVSAVPTGTRLDLKPSVTLPLQGAAWYLKPTAALRYTSYSLEDYPQGDSFERSLPILSLDSGLFFDRDTSIAGSAMTQTLEPRLFYLSVPYEDQDQLPLFDTANNNLSFNQLFSDNRFSGPDRQGDANQLTTALTTRLLNRDDGSERLRASIGRTHYFDDRQVRLNTTDPIDTTPHSDLFAELELQPVERLRIGINTRYDSELERSTELNGRIRYQPDAKRLLSLDYRYDELDQLRQTDTLLFWPVARQWQLLGRWRYDLDNEENLDLLAGVEYESCCWSVRLIGRNHRSSANDELEHSFYLTFGFKGLGSLGGQLEDALEEGLLAYE
ncbi:MAG: LPS assembly protein LptD [Pseudomonadota bacterium]